MRYRPRERTSIQEDSIAAVPSAKDGVPGESACSSCIPPPESSSEWFRTGDRKHETVSGRPIRCIRDTPLSGGLFRQFL